MDSATAHPDTLSDVNLLILDYLACLAIEGILSRPQDGDEYGDGDGGVGWLVSSVNSKSSDPPYLTLPDLYESADSCSTGL